VQPVAKQYVDDSNLKSRQKLWHASLREPAFSLPSWVVGMARLDGTESVLEVGCGNGAYLELIRGVGLDISAGMLSAARLRTTNPLVRGDAAVLPFLTDSFDVVLAPFMLYHVSDRAAAVRELRRVLRPSGICIAVTSGERNQHELVALVEEQVGQGWQWRRPSAVAFSLENGMEQMRIAFSQIELIRCPPSVVSVTDSDVLADYLRSVGDTYEHEIEGTWEDLVLRCRAKVGLAIRDNGSFPISSSIGAFLCR
jgi:SAM-dependent methyltransferase